MDREDPKNSLIDNERFRSNLLSIVSHELNTPLTGIINEPQIADSNESIVVTRETPFDVVVEDFDVMQPGLTGFGEIWGSLYATPAAGASSTDYVDADFAAILFEPNE